MADDDAPDEDELTDAEIAAMAAAALKQLHRQRDRTHDDAAAALAALLALLASGIDAHALYAVIDPTASRDARRAAVAAELQRQARVLDLDTNWHDVARDAHTAAILAGTAAAAHVLSAGHIPAEPEAGAWLPNPFDAEPWVAQQRAGLAGDIVDAVARAEKTAAAQAAAVDTEPDLLAPAVPGVSGLEDIGLTAEDLARIVDDGGGALYYLDVQVSDAYLGATTALYLEMGFADLWWCAIGDSRTCKTCLDYEAASPYTRSELPATPHGGCRCFVMAGASAP
jgi:hypothetical protein